MTTAFRLVAIVVALSMMLAGPLAPLAFAQQSAPPSSSDAYQERLQVSQEESAAYEAGAPIVNAFYIPGKAILCGLGGAVGLGVLLLTFGSGYKAAAAVAREGCGGKWAVTGDDLKPDRSWSSPQSN
jgi:hypothetical protein